MATKRLYVDGTTGVMMISDADTPLDALSNPANYLSKLNFHSGLPYLRAITTITVAQITFPELIREIRVYDDGSKGGCF